MGMRTPNRLVLLSGLTLAFGLAGCIGGTKQNEKKSESGSSVPVSAHSAAAPPAAADLRFTAPSEWITETPSSSLRKAQYRLAKVTGDPDDAELAVFFFPGGGGPVQANIERWIAQFQKTDGSPAAGTTSRREVHGMPLTIVDVNGIYLSGSGTMSAVKPKPDFRMLAAVVETSSGPWFFKLTGPAKTVGKWEASFQSFLDTIQ
jgi:hypothetical protein